MAPVWCMERLQGLDVLKPPTSSVAYRKEQTARTDIRGGNEVAEVTVLLSA